MSMALDELMSMGMCGQKDEAVKRIRTILNNAKYQIVEEDSRKPWGAYFRLDGKQAKQFLSEFFPGLSIEEARLGVADAELSPKILLVSPGHRLSWQYHHRRAERWHFLTKGAFNKSQSDEQGQVTKAVPGDIIQFAKGERHRLVGDEKAYTVVAEIWQHSYSNNPSDEDDIVRLADDYSR